MMGLWYRHLARGIGRRWWPLRGKASGVCGTPATQGVARTGGNTKPFHAGTILWRPLRYSFWHLRKDLIREVLYPTRRN
jgi:hypothetical protein